MTDIVTTPAIDALPPAPSPTDAPEAFNSKSFATLAAQEGMVTQVNASNAATEQNATAAHERAVIAATKAGEALASANAAEIARVVSEGARDDAQAAAAAVGAAAGLPALAGKALKLLRVKTDESGVEWAEPQLKTVNGQTLFGAGNISTDVWATGDVRTTAATPGVGWIETNKIYLQASYPELFAKVGLASNGFSSSAISLPVAGLSVAYGNGKFVAVWDGSADSRTSAGGVTWETHTSTGLSAMAWNSVAFGAGIFVAISGTTAAASSIFATSSDGKNWTTRSVPSGKWRAITYGGGLFVAVSHDGSVLLTSADGITWTSRAITAVSGRSSVAYNNGKYITAGSLTVTSTAYASSDGITWSAITMPANGFWAVSAGGGLFIATISNSETCYISADGNSWLPSSIGAAVGWKGAVYAYGIFVLFGGTATLAWSTDCRFWNLATASVAATFIKPASGASRILLASSGVSIEIVNPFIFDTATQFYVPKPNGISQPYTDWIKS